ncbi:MAG TPA: CBS and ACT domain-containing protein [Rubrobacteraceae bacterium]|nr:CBS and ACT domain-containing protein [Rubrobacteraceae bacterium]
MLRVRDAMTREVITLGPDASAAQALGVCRVNNIRHLPIVERGRLVGLVSDRDLRDVSPPRGTGDEENTLGWVRVRDIMTRELITIHPLDTIEHAARELADRRIGCLPVVADGELVGIITSSDMMHTLMELVGAHGPGSWIEVEVPNEPGMLAEVTNVIRERHVNIASVFLAPASRATYRTIVLRLETTDPSGIAERLTAAGYVVTSTESSAPVERYFERR